MASSVERGSKSAGGKKERKQQGPLFKSLVTGSAVVLEMLTFGLLLENIKMEKQRTSLPYPTIARSILRQGLGGVWAGFWPWGFILGMTKGSVLGGARAFFLNTFEKHMSKPNADLVSGFLAGSVQGVAMSPVLLARTRVNQSLTERALAAGNKRATQGLLAEMRLSQQILAEGYREEGFAVITKGMGAMVFKRTLDWGSRFVIISKFKQLLAPEDGTPLGDGAKLAAAFFGGATSCALTMPIDRMMPILQQSRASDEGIATFLRKKIKAEGITTLQRGFLMRAMHTGWHTAFAVFVADKIYNFFE